MSGSGRGINGTNRNIQKDIKEETENKYKKQIKKIEKEEIRIEEIRKKKSEKRNRNRRKEKIMKKKFKLEDLDCANCAAKMENAIKKIEGVNDASVSFLAQKMTIDAQDERFDDIMKEVVKVCAKVEPDCRILL